MGKKILIWLNKNLPITQKEIGLKKEAQANTKNHNPNTKNVKKTNEDTRDRVK
tara:strand:- start:41 stop:199 length:159 start_codon:yes stop_codon:yes gene_type:complete